MTTKLRSVFWAIAQPLASDTRGATLVLVAAAISALIGFTGLGVETGLWYAMKRQNQSAADVSALSGAVELVAGQPYSDICKLAGLAANANGFASFAPSTCSSGCSSPPPGSNNCVNNPPVLPVRGAAGTANMVEVILAQPQSTFFASLFMPSVTIGTRAVAGLNAFKTCMIALGAGGTDLQNNGNTTINLNSCSFASNSVTDTNPNYSIKFNGNVTMTAGAISTAGGDKITGNSNSISPPVTTHASPVTDPYNPAGIPWITVPPLASLVPRGCPATTGGTFLPGYYTCGANKPAMAFTSGTATLCPGVYVLDGDKNGEGFSVHNSGTTVNMGIDGSGPCVPASGSNGVTIITTCTSGGAYGGNCGGGFVIGGNGGDTPSVTLSAPTSGVPNGCVPGLPPCIPPRILFYQVASTADPGPGHPGNSVFSGPAVSLNGVVYTPSTELQLQGSPTFGSCTELIANDFVVGGTATMNAPAAACGIISSSVSTLVLLE
jgi:Flp pilus assembly protein TadG